MPLSLYPCKFPVRPRTYLSQKYRYLSTPSSFQHIEKCPAPRCSCQPTPQGLDIDRDKPLAGTVASYHEQAVVCTGRTDWPSKIEDDAGLPLVQGLKKYLGAKGKFFNPFHNVLVTASSLSGPTTEEHTALLFPSFKQVSIPPQETEFPQNLETFVRGYILAESLTNWKLPTPPPNPESLVRDVSLSSAFETLPINDVVILICGHGARDSRCGIMAPVLEDEFLQKLGGAGYLTAKTLSNPKNFFDQRVLIGSISHIGGHKYAGNVIVYIPPTLEDHPLAGCGVWYGRVEPLHVDGIIQKTIKEGLVIQELFRGGIDSQRRPIFL